jgi:hypothetical protein
MLGMSSYPQAYVDSCRARIDLQLSKYRALVKTAKKPAVDAFEPIFFGNLVLGYEIGNTIAVDEAGFVKLSKAFFAEMKAKFVDA